MVMLVLLAIVRLSYIANHHNLLTTNKQKNIMEDLVAACYSLQPRATRFFLHCDLLVKQVSAGVSRVLG